MKEITLTIDGLKIHAAEGTTVLRAALAGGIYIPHLCDHPDLDPAGVCRLCMVQIEGRRPALACRTPVEQGLVVRTEGPEIDNVRRVTTELLIVNHPEDCLACCQNNQCELQRIAAYVGVDPKRLARLRRGSRELPVDSSNPFFNYDPNRCVLCGICVRTCEDLQGVGAIDFAHRGYDTVVATFWNQPIAESRCESCGECVVRCPVGALAPKNVQQPAREVRTTCAYCGVGCGIHLGIRGDRLVSVRGDRDRPTNRGSLCVKGRYGHGYVNHPDRLTTPLIRRTGVRSQGSGVRGQESETPADCVPRGGSGQGSVVRGQFVEASWDEALDLIAEKFAESKGEKFAALASAKCTNEENYLIQKMTRAVMGTNSIDHCARL